MVCCIPARFLWGGSRGGLDGSPVDLCLVRGGPRHRRDGERARRFLALSIDGSDILSGGRHNQRYGERIWRRRPSAPLRAFSRRGWTEEGAGGDGGAKAGRGARGLGERATRAIGLGFDRAGRSLYTAGVKCPFCPERLRRNNGHCHRARRDTEISSH